MKKKDPIDEAMRYVVNAEEIIKKAEYDTELKSYTDSKYIKTAGDILWKGCLVALDAALGVRKGKGRPSIDRYKKAAANRDRKLLNSINIGYNILHLTMGYDGAKSTIVCNEGFKYAKDIINRCSKLCPEMVCA